MFGKIGPLVATALFLSAEILTAHELLLRGGLATGEHQPFFTASQKKDDLFGTGLAGATDGALSGTWRSDTLRSLPLYLGYIHPDSYYAAFDFYFQESNFSRSSLYNTRISGNDGQLAGRERLEKYRLKKQILEAGYRLQLDSPIILFAGVREWSASGDFTGKSRGSGVFAGQREFLGGHIQPGSGLSLETIAPLAGLRSHFKTGPVELALALRFFSGTGSYRENATTSFYNTGFGVLAAQTAIRQTKASMKEQGFDLQLDVDYPLAENLSLFGGIGYEATEVRLENILSIHLLERESFFQERTASHRSDFLVFDETEFLHDRLTYARQSGHTILLRFGVASKIGL